MDGKNEIQGYMSVGRIRCKGTCGWGGNEMPGYMWMGGGNEMEGYMWMGGE